MEMNKLVSFYSLSAISFREPLQSLTRLIIPQETIRNYTDQKDRSFSSQERIGLPLLIKLEI
jgi:hypothetical protein